MESNKEFHAISIDALTLHAPLAGLQWWRAKLAAHGAVRRADVEPLLEIPRLLAQATLFAREADGWSIRVVGSEIDRQLGGKLAGQPLTVTMPAPAPALITLLDQATALHLPHACAGALHRPEAAEALSWQAVLLPLQHQVPRILAVGAWTIELLDEPLDMNPFTT